MTRTLNGGPPAATLTGAEAWAAIQSGVDVTVTAAGLVALASAGNVRLTGNQSIDGTKTFTSAPVVPVGTFARTGQFSVLDYGGVPDAVSTVNKPAVLAAFTAASASTYGGEVVLPPGVWNVADLGLVWTSGKPVTLDGAGVGVTYLYFSTDRGAGTMALSGPGVRVRNMTINGPGTSFVMGASPANLTGVELQSRANLQNVTLQGFRSAVKVVGDHTYMQTVKCLNNYYGELYADATTAGDHTRIDCDLSGNMRSSIGVATTGVMDAATYVRGHLGFSPFCIEFESGGATDWVGMVDSQFVGTAFEYAGNGFIYNSDQKVMLTSNRLDQCRPFTSNAAFKIAALAVQPEVYVGTVDGIDLRGDGPAQWDCITIRRSVWDGWKGAYARSVVAGVPLFKAYMGLSGLSGTFLLTGANSRAVAFSAAVAVAAGQVVEYSGSVHYVQPHNPSGANGGSMIAGVALTAAAAVTGVIRDVCIAVQEDFEGQTPVQVAGAGPYGANDMLFAVGTVGKVDNAAGAGGGYQGKAIIGRVAGVTAVAGGKLSGVIIKVTDAGT